MLILITMIILITSSSILWSIYSNFFYFQQNYENLNNYYNWFYGAVSSIERAFLSSKIQWVWYDSSWGFLWNNARWSKSDSLTWKFWKFNDDQNWIFWQLDWKTKMISWQISHQDLLWIILMTSNSPDPYSWEINYKFFDGSNYISWIFYQNDFKIDNTENIQLDRVMLTNWTWFFLTAYGSWNKISNANINNEDNIYFSQGTHDIFSKTATSWSWFISSWVIQTWSIWDTLNWDKISFAWFYINSDLLTWNTKVPHLNYNINSKNEFSDIFYNITWSSVVWNYKKDIFIKKPVLNINNPNEKYFIFPYYQ